MPSRSVLEKSSLPGQGELPARQERDLRSVLVGLACRHPQLAECHPGCGHWYCPDCDLEWDDHAEM